MRVAVYGIAKDEAANVGGWSSCKDEADYVLLGDTGSTDRTVEVARDAGVRTIRLSVSPWRFDDARNALLAHLPADVDYCVSLDLDERLQPGWRKALEEAVQSGITRVLYPYVWNWREDGTPGITFLRDHAHPRHGYRWRHPVHEVVEPVPGVAEVRGEAPGMTVLHFGDQTKDRTSYLPLLEQAVAEDPYDDRNSHYLAREYLFAGRWDRAEDEFRRHLALPKAIWKPERSASMRYLAEVIWLRRHDLPGGPEEAEGWYLRAAAEAPEYREPWYALMQHYLRTNRPLAAVGMARRGCEVTERRLDYITTPEPWSGVMEQVGGAHSADAPPGQPALDPASA